MGTPSKYRKPRAGMSIKKINLELLNKRLHNILSRDVNHLLVASHNAKLDAKDAQSLCNYLKLMKDLKVEEEKNLSNLSDAELEKIANKEKKNHERKESNN